MSDAAVRVDEIAAAEWSPRLGALGAVVQGAEDVEQCIRIILATPRGTVPHRPELGCDLWRYLDLPAERARPFVVREVVDALERWEPRAELVGVAAHTDPANAAALVVEVTYRVRGAAERTTAVRIER